jgi:SpoVK/Ycf46/Vps4 family AAA+-type ATPase
MGEYDPHDIEQLEFTSMSKLKPSNKRAENKEGSVRELLADQALAKALSPEVRKALAAGSPGAVVVLVPSAQWVNQIDGAVDEISEEHYSVLRTGERKNEGEDSNAASRRLADGQLVVAVTPSARFLPPVLRTVVNHTVTIAPPDATLVAAVIRKLAVGRIPPGFSGTNISVLDFDELAALIGAGGDARSICERITRAILGRTRMAHEGENLPDMATATEWGEARLWALDLKADIDDMRNGTISWAEVDKGCVLHSIPGCGKSLFARSLGEYLGVPVIIASMADFFAGGSGYLDSVIKAQRAVFEKARAAAPCVLFLDEVDATPDLDQISNRGKDWWSPVVLDFLQLLDSATADRNGVVVIGATNRIASIAPAILRPGRLERAIRMDPPDAAGIERILRHHLNGALADVDLGKLAAACAMRSMTGAVIMEAVRAARRIARRASRPMVIEDLESRVFVPERRTEADMARICVHEAGHALIGSTDLGPDLQSVSIEQINETSGGHTAFKYSANFIETRKDAMARIRVLLAGRGAEFVVYGDFSDGAGGTADSDLALATKTLAVANMSLGMGSKIGWRCEPDEVMKFMAIDREARHEVDTELAAIFESVVDDIRKQRGALDAITRSLREMRTLDAAQVRSLIDGASGPKRTAAA